MKVQHELALSLKRMDDALEKFLILEELARPLAAKRHQQRVGSRRNPSRRPASQHHAAAGSRAGAAPLAMPQHLRATDPSREAKREVVPLH
jgi:hypothetical protein